MAKYKENWTSYNIKGIRANAYSKDGKRLFSGQDVLCTDHMGNRRIRSITFEPNHGFRVGSGVLSGSNIAEIAKDVSLATKILGTLEFTLYNLFGVQRQPKEMS